MTHATPTQAPLVHDWRNFIPGQPSIITAETWQTRNALAERHYPQICDLMSFSEDHLLDILMDVEQDEKPPREFPVGPPDSPYPLAWLPRRSWLEWHLFRGIAPAARRDAVPTHVRAAVMERDGLTCQICYTPVELGDVHLDHIKPWSRGGQHTVANLRVTHSLCNIKRGAPDGA